MIWELAAIWAIVVGTVGWFVRSEMQERRVARYRRSERVIARPMVAQTAPGQPFVHRDSERARRKFLEAMLREAD